MKHLLAFALAAAVLAVSVPAQEATPKPVRKFFQFLPGVRKPAATPEPVTPVPVATPKPTPKATPKPTPKATPKPTPKANPPATPKPVVKATPKPATPPEIKVEAPPEPKPEDKLKNTSLEAIAPMPATPPPATPAPKPTAPPRDVSAKAPATPPLVKAPAATPAKAAATAAVVTAATLPEKPVTPAVITSTVPPEPAQIVRAFFGLLGKGDIDGAYGNLMKGSKIGERPEEVRTLKSKTKEAIDVFGLIHGYDLVDIKPVGERLMRATYLSLGHELPLRWRFYFYKADTDWKLIDLRVDDKLTGIFDEAMEELPRGSDLRP
ncbi:MAG: hypothetical protein WCF18_10340 [Chthoniobacteraceae bacterium]